MSDRLSLGKYFLLFVLAASLTLNIYLFLWGNTQTKDVDIKEVIIERIVNVPVEKTESIWSDTSLLASPVLTYETFEGYPTTQVAIRCDSSIFFDPCYPMIQVKSLQDTPLSFLSKHVNANNLLLSITQKDTPIAFQVVLDRRIGMRALMLPARQNYSHQVIPIAPTQNQNNIAPKLSLPVNLNSINTHEESMQPYLVLDFSAPVMLDSLKSLISFDPEVQNLSFTRSYWGTHGVKVKGDFKPESFYAFKLKSGPLGLQSQCVEKEDVRGIVVPKLRGGVQLLSKGEIFPYSREQNIPIKIVGAQEFKLKVTQIIPENLHPFLMNASSSCVEKTILDTQFSTPLNTQSPVDANLPITHFMKKLPVGIYKIYASPASHYWWEESQRLIVTNIGIHAVSSHQQISLTARSLDSGAPIAQATVNCYDQTFASLYETQTDSHGGCIIPANKDIMWVIVRQGNDVSYMRYRDYYANNHKPYFAYVSPERYNVRQDESFTVFATLRHSNTREASAFVPAKFFVQNPNGELFLSENVTTDTFGFARATFTLPKEIDNGYYSIYFSAPMTNSYKDAWGNASVYVSRYVQDRIHVNINQIPDTTFTEKLKLIKGISRYYFGLPAASLQYTYTMEANIEPFSHTKYSKYDFGFIGKRASYDVRYFTRGTTDSQGNFETSLPSNVLKWNPNAPLSLYHRISVMDVGGRTVSSSITQKMYNDSAYLGLAFDEQSNVLSWVNVTPSGDLLPLVDTLYYCLEKEDYSYNYVFRNGEYSREYSASYQTLITDSLFANIGKDSNGLTLPTLDPGSYRVRVSNSAKIPLTQFDFYYQQSYSKSDESLANQLLFEMDKTSYQLGETATVTVRVPRKGVLFVRTPDMKFPAQGQDVVAGENQFKIQIPHDLKCTQYQVHAVVIADLGQKVYEPNCLSGILRLKVNMDAYKMNVKMDAPPMITSKEKMKIKVCLTDHQGAPVSGRVQLWGVDQGVLALSPHQMVSPWQFIYQDYNPMRWNLTDIYSNICTYIDLTQSIFGGDAISFESHSAMMHGGVFGRRGGAGAEGRRSFLNVLQKSVVVVAEPVEVSDSGEATMTLEAPEFSGQLTWFAIALDTQKAGFATTSTIVRNDITITPSLPLCMGVGDEGELSFGLTLFNLKDSAAKIEWQVMIPEAYEVLDQTNFTYDSVNQMQRVSSTFSVSELEMQKLEVKLKARTPSEKIPVTINVTLNGKTETATIYGAVRHRIPLVTREQLLVVKPEESHPLRLDTNFLGLTDVAQARYEISSLPVSELLGALDWLNRYPYGCLEQTTSVAFPYLAIQPLVQANILPQVFIQEGEKRVQMALDRLNALRVWRGFSMWSEGERWDAGSLYAIHFILEAKAQGHKVPDPLLSAVNEMYDYLSFSTDAEKAYLNYVKLLSGNRSVIPYVQKMGLETQSNVAKFFVGATLMKAGLSKQGNAYLQTALQNSAWNDIEGFGCFNSRARQLGFMLFLTMDVAPESIYVNKMALELRQMVSIQRNQWWGSTQANAWALMGLSRWLATQSLGEVDYVVDGGAKDSGMISFDQIPTVTNKGKSSLYVKISALGLPTKVASESQGVEIKRTYMNAERTAEIDSFMQGDMVCVKIEVNSTQSIKDLVILDLLPGCFEIEDERLSTRACRSKSVDNVSGGLYTKNIQKCDERMLFFGDYTPGKVGVFYYNVRVINKGKYAVPSVSIEAMYNPEIRATQTSKQMIDVR